MIQAGDGIEKVGMKRKGRGLKTKTKKRGEKYRVTERIRCVIVCIFN